LSRDSENALSVAILSKGEKIIGKISTEYETVRHFSRQKWVVMSEQVTEKTKSGGYLFFTNIRLLFIENRGFFRPSFHCRTSINYEEIISVDTGGWILAYFSIVDKLGTEHRFHISSESKIVAKRMLEVLISQRKIDMEKEKKVVNVTLDLSFLRPLAEKGVVLKDFSCPYCGGKLEVPTSGRFFECKYCGRKVYAIDVFDRIKSLINLTAADVTSNIEEIERSPPPPPSDSCPVCYQSLTLIQQYNRWYCYKCKQYR
jgi:hypothetical protein